METRILILLAFCLFHTQIIAIQTLSVTDINTDQSALLALKNSIISARPQSILTKNWTNATPVCSWAGVTCSVRRRRVIGLSISNMNLAGTLPSQLGNLSFLETIDLSINAFQGSVPEDLVRLHRLRVMKLNDNELSGDIPSWIGYLSNLEVLSFANNSFTGFIPHSLFNLSKLEVLYLFSNRLEGEIPDMFGNFGALRSFAVLENQLIGTIPYTLFDVSSIQTIVLAHNNLSGTLWDDMCKNTPNLQQIYLHENTFHGDLQGKFQNCYALRDLAIWQNNFSGRIPKELGNLTSLVGMDFGLNRFTGEIPQEIGQLYNLEVLNLHSNDLTGPIPTGIFNISGLSTLALDHNHLTGRLPSTMGQGILNLEILFLSYNKLNGPIPASISNCSLLNVVDIGFNEFTGFIPYSLGELSLLEILYFDANNLTSDESPSSELRFITSLTKCTSLQELEFSLNPVNGILPSSVGNLSASLKLFSAEYAMIRGSLPMEFGNLSNLIMIRLSGNQISGSIPESLAGLQRLERLYLDSNLMDGSFASPLCDLKTLGDLDLSTNQFSGAIPSCLGNVTSLRYISLDNNKFTSNIPESLWQLKDVLNLSLSHNNLSGSISPQIGGLKSLFLFDVSFNQLSGSIPTTIGGLSSLSYVSLDHNAFQGSIPDSIGGMFSLEFLNLSHNMISGSIPKSLERLRFLQVFDVSFNHLRGEIPTGGPFNNFTSQSFMLNEALCSNHTKYNVPPCPPNANPSSSHTTRKRVIIYVVLIVLGAALLTTVFTLFLVRRRKRNNVVQGQELISPIRPERISYYELVQATDGFSESNWLGSGSYGSVYKGVLKDGTLVAVKRFNMQAEDAFKSFDRECEVLRNLRHRNLTKVISSCSNSDFKAIVLEYIPTGSLEKWLYSHNYSLSIRQRLDIMLEVAYALEYLHHGCSTTVVHCDIKPSNILLDEDMVAHVTDFGIAKSMHEGNSIDHTKTLATFGYMAPEYGLEGLISTRSDVYSYGIMLMEVFTRVKPSEEMFLGDKSLKSWVKDHTPNETIQVVDGNMLKANENNLEEKLNCVSTIFDLALHCSADFPSDRLNMQQVVAMLQAIKVKFHAYLEETQTMDTTISRAMSDYSVGRSASHI